MDLNKILGTDVGSEGEPSSLTNSVIARESIPSSLVKLTFSSAVSVASKASVVLSSPSPQQRSTESRQLRTIATEAPSRQEWRGIVSGSDAMQASLSQSVLSSPMYSCGVNDSWNKSSSVSSIISGNPSSVSLPTSTSLSSACMQSSCTSPSNSPRSVMVITNRPGPKEIEAAEMMLSLSQNLSRHANCSPQTFRVPVNVTQPQCLQNAQENYNQVKNVRTQRQLSLIEDDVEMTDAPMVSSIFSISHKVQETQHQFPPCPIISLSSPPSPSSLSSSLSISSSSVSTTKGFSSPSVSSVSLESLFLSSVSSNSPISSSSNASSTSASFSSSNSSSPSPSSSSTSSASFSPSNSSSSSSSSPSSTSTISPSANLSPSQSSYSTTSPSSSNFSPNSSSSNLSPSQSSYSTTSPSSTSSSSNLSATPNPTFFSSASLTLSRASKELNGSPSCAHRTRTSQRTSACAPLLSTMSSPSILVMSKKATQSNSSSIGSRIKRNSPPNHNQQTTILSPSNTSTSTITSTSSTTIVYPADDQEELFRQPSTTSPTKKRATKSDVNKDGAAASPSSRKLIPSPAGLPCPNCNVNASTLWRTCETSNGNLHLCNACGLRFKKGKFCPICYKVYYDADTNHQNWKQCQSCYNWTHKECLKKKNSKKLDKTEDNEEMDVETESEQKDEGIIKKSIYKCLVCTRAQKNIDRH